MTDQKKTITITDQPALLSKNKLSPIVQKTITITDQPALFSQNKLSNNTQRKTDQKKTITITDQPALLRKINLVNLNSPVNYHNHRPNQNTPKIN